MCIRDIFQTDDYSPTVVHKEEEYDQMLKRFPYQDLNLHQVICDENAPW